MPKLFIFLAMLTVSSPALAKALICRLVQNPEASTLKITYSNNSPFEVYSKSQKASEFKKLNKSIEVVLPNDGEGNESFTVKPNLQSPIDWSKEANCYKEIGSLWYFVLNHKANKHFIQIAPYIILKDNRCVPPRYAPQDHELNCSFD